MITLSCPGWFATVVLLAATVAILAAVYILMWMYREVLDVREYVGTIEEEYTRVSIDLSEARHMYEESEASHEDLMQRYERLGTAHADGVELLLKPSLN